jgi:hypothetical protein
MTLRICRNLRSLVNKQSALSAAFTNGASVNRYAIINRSLSNQTFLNAQKFTPVNHTPLECELY